VNNWGILAGEVVRFARRRHVVTLLGPLAAIVLAGILVGTESCPIALALDLDGKCPLVVAFALVAASLPFVLDWLTTRFILTDQRLLLVRAPLWLRARSLWLEDVAGLSVRQGVLGRVGNFGDLWVDTPATRRSFLLFAFAPDPLVLRDQIAAAVTARKLGTAGDA